MNNLLSYCGLVDARISASGKDLPVTLTKRTNLWINEPLFLDGKELLGNKMSKKNRGSSTYLKIFVKKGRNEEKKDMNQQVNYEVFIW